MPPQRASSSFMHFIERLIALVGISYNIFELKRFARKYEAALLEAGGGPSRPRHHLANRVLVVVYGVRLLIELPDHGVLSVEENGNIHKLVVDHLLKEAGVYPKNL